MSTYPTLTSLAGLKRLMNRLRARKLHDENADALITDWSITDADAKIIQNEIIRFQQREFIRVAEFGCGYSTFIILSELERIFTRRYEFTSLEEDKIWFDRTTSLLDGRLPVTGNYNTVLGSFCTAIPSSPYYTFTLSAINNHKIDLAFVDAPSDTRGEDVRLMLCRELVPLLSSKGVLVLHDTNRINEKYATRMLSSLFYETDVYDTEKGISVLRFPR